MVEDKVIDPKRPWVSFDPQIRPHSKGEVTIRPLQNVDAADQLKGPSVGDKCTTISKLKKE